MLQFTMSTTWRIKKADNILGLQSKYIQPQQLNRKLQHTQKWRAALATPSSSIVAPSTQRIWTADPSDNGCQDLEFHFEASARPLLLPIALARKRETVVHTIQNRVSRLLLPVVMVSRKKRKSAIHILQSHVPRLRLPGILSITPTSLVHEHIGHIRQRTEHLAMSTGTSLWSSYRCHGGHRMHILTSTLLIHLHHLIHRAQEQTLPEADHNKRIAPLKNVDHVVFPPSRDNSVKVLVLTSILAHRRLNPTGRIMSLILRLRVLSLAQICTTYSKSPATLQPMTSIRHIVP